MKLVEKTMFLVLCLGGDFSFSSFVQFVKGSLQIVKRDIPNHYPELEFEFPAHNSKQLFKFQTQD